jgi:hypothetical protein
MKKLTYTEIEREAQRVKEEYAYMDDMPLEGWMWEFIRRTNAYNSLFNLYQKERTEILEEVGKVFKEHFSPEEKPDLSKEVFIRLANDEETKEALLTKHIYSIESWPVTKRLFDLNEKAREMGISIEITDNELTSEVEFFYPDPTRRYNQFPQELKPSTIYKYPVKHYTYESLLDFCKNHCDGPPSPPVFIPFDDPYLVADVVSGPFAIHSKEDTLFLGISRNAKKELIMRHIEEILDLYLNPSRERMRIDKWKYYLICFDSRKHEYTYSAISEILIDAFPSNKRVLDEKNIENYWKQAHLLIDGGEYKKYFVIKDA